MNISQGLPPFQFIQDREGVLGDEDGPVEKVLSGAFEFQTELT